MGVMSISDDAHQDRELIRLVCDQKMELHVTRSLLIRSSTYFAAMLSEESAWKESSNGTIELDGWSPNDLATILRSIKTENVEPIFEDVNRYFAAINYFSITPLIEQCIEFKLKNISDESVIGDLSFAESFSVGQLRDECMEHLLRRLPEILRNSRKSRMEVSVELFQKLLRNEKLAVRHEDEVLSLIDIWCSSGNRQSERVKLLQEVRFAHLTEKAFEKCRDDAQCQEVPQFRLLLKTSRWSDLGENFLSGRKSIRGVHLHVVGILRARLERKQKKDEMSNVSAKGVCVHCSQSGTLSSVRGALSEAYVTLMMDRLCSAVSGKGLYVCRRAGEPHHMSWRHRVATFTELQYFSDSRDSKPSSTIRFPKLIFAAAPPVVFEGDLFIAHSRYKSKPTRVHGYYWLQAEDFDELELLRYHDGEATSRKLRLPLEPDSRPHFRRDLVSQGANKLLVNEEWTILCVPDQGVLLVIDAPRPVGPVITMPERCWNLEGNDIFKLSTSSDVVMVDNVAYVLLRFSLYEEVWHPNGRDCVVCGDWPVGSITAYDLTDGKWLPGHFLDLGPVSAERDDCDRDWLEFTLKVVQNEIFIIVVVNRIGEIASGFPVAAMNYVYRLKRCADSLSMSPVSESAIANRCLRRSGNARFAWQGVPLSVDAHPCEYATALQLRASREEDPIEREKLRRFTW